MMKKILLSILSVLISFFAVAQDGVTGCEVTADTLAVNGAMSWDATVAMTQPVNETMLWNATSSNMMPSNETVSGSPLVAPGEIPDSKKTRSRRDRSSRFLPTSHRIDREVDKIKFAYKGEVIMGITAAFGTLSSDDTDFMLIIDNFDAKGTIASVNPFIGYFYRDNQCLGVRFGYRHIDGSLGNVDLDFGKGNDLSLSIGDMALNSNNFSFGLFHRSYIGLDHKGRFGLFAELELAMTSGSNDFSYKAHGETKKTYSDTFMVGLSFNPGVAVYIFPNVCGTLSFGLGGIQYSTITQRNENGVKVGSRDASKMMFRLNLANINIGMTVHLWDKKKK